MIKVEDIKSLSETKHFTKKRKKKKQFLLKASPRLAPLAPS